MIKMTAKPAQVLLIQSLQAPQCLAYNHAEKVSLKTKQPAYNETKSPQTAGMLGHSRKRWAAVSQASRERRSPPAVKHGAASRCNISLKAAQQTVQTMTQTRARPGLQGLQQKEEKVLEGPWQSSDPSRFRDATACCLNVYRPWSSSGRTSSFTG